MGWAQRRSASSLTGVRCVERELALEHHVQLVLRERLPERALGQQPRHGLGVHRLVEQLPPCPAAALGAVHRGVGVTEKP